MFYRAIVCPHRLQNWSTQYRSCLLIAHQRWLTSAATRTRPDTSVQTPNGQHNALQPAARREDLSDAKLEATSTTVPTEICPAKGRVQRKDNIINRPALHASSEHHNDLKSFLSYAERSGLNPTTTVYRGTHYEYTVAEALKRFNFALHRTGRSNDLGIDLIGQWTIPANSSLTNSNGSSGRLSLREIPVLVQCKASKSQPSMIRELEGAYVGAPAGWRGESVIALLVGTEPATKGVREAMQRSNCPIAILQIARGSEVLQFLWNYAAARNGLEGLGVTVEYGTEGPDGKSVGRSQGVALTWLGKILKTNKG